MKTIIVGILLLLLNSVVFAVEISQVLFNPEDESSGEAIELFNPSSESINISKWYVSTERSEKDIIIPEKAFIQPKSSYLIADPGWNSSKNQNWRNADYQESMTLKNEDSWLVLKDNSGRIIDKANWSNGVGLVRINNSLIYGIPQFFEKNIIPLEVLIEKGDDIIIPDESNRTGIQINPISGETKKVPIKIKSNKQPKLEFLEETIFMTKESDNSYYSEIELPYNLPASNYTIKIGNQTTSFEYLRLEDFDILTKHAYVLNNKGSIRLINKGNTDLTLAITAELPINASLKTKRVQLSINEEKEVILEFLIDENAAPGRYNGVLRIEKD